MNNGRNSIVVRIGFWTSFFAVAGGYARAQIFDETCSVSVNGRTAQVRADGGFTITNVPVAVDVFRVTGVCQGTGVPLYILGDQFFQMATTGQTVNASVILDSVAPPKVESISVTTDAATLTMPGQTTQLHVIAHYSGGTTDDVSPRMEGTAYRTTNPAIASVSLDGLVTAMGNGTALITVSNQGSTAVLAITVSLGDPLTTVEGFVQLDDGTPVNGASVTLNVGGSGTSGPDGAFSINNVASLLGPIIVEAQAVVGMMTLYGQSLEIEPMPGAITDAGIVSIGNKVYWITNGNGNWNTGSNWNTGIPPTSGQIAVIDRPGMNLAVTVSSGTNTPAGIICEETIQLTGGTLAPTESSEIATLNIVSGTLGGTGDIVVKNSIGWSAGTMTGAGTTSVGFGGTMSISGTATKTLSGGRTLSNEGTMTWSGTGTLFVNNGATIANAAGAIFEIQNDTTVTNNVAPSGTISNAGTLRKIVGVGTSTIGSTVALNNTGTVSAQSGVLSLQGGGTSTGLFICASGASINIDTGAYNFGTGADTNGPGFVRVSGGTLSVGTSVTANADNLAVASGTLGGAGNLIVRGTLDWSGGTMNNAGTTTVATTGTLSINGTATKTTTGSRQLVNNGMGTWAGTGTWFINNGAAFTNSATGVFTMQNATTVTNNVAPNGTMSNAGTVGKSSAGTSTIGSTVAFNNTGTLSAQSGIISLQGGGTSTGLFSCASGASINIDTGTYNFGTGADTNGPGFVGVSGGTLSVGNGLTANAENLALSSGTLRGAGEIIVRGTLNWSGGTMNDGGLTTVTAQGDLDINGTATKTMTGGRQLVNNGSGTWTGTGTWFVNNSSLFNNAAGAIFEIQNDTTVTNNVAPSGTISNAGTLRKIVGVGTSTIGSTVALNNTGTVSAQSGVLSLQGGGTSTGLFICASGASINIDTGAYNFGTGADTNGPGFVRVSGGTLSVGTSVTANADNLAVASGTLGGAGNLIVRGTLDWSGGTMNNAGTTTVATTGTLSINGTATKTTTGSRQLVNNGMGTWAGTGTWFINNGAAFTNSATGVFTMQNATTVTNNVAPNGTMSNAGTVGKSSAGTSTIGSTVAFNNTGTLSAQSGIISLQGGGTSTGLFSCASGASINIDTGTYNFGTGADTNGPGFVGVSGGTLSVGNGLTANAENLALSSGTLRGAGEIIVRGTLNWSGGTMNDGGLTTVTAQGDLDINGTATKTMTGGRQLVNNGSGTWTGTGTWFVNNSSLFNNAAGAIFEIQNDTTVTNNVAPNGAISNAGTLMKSIGVGTSTILSTVPLTNSGTIDAQSGTLSIGSFTQTSGETILDGGSISSGATVNFNGGVVSGGGMITANVSNAGQFAPGFSPGTLAITGTYSQTAAGSLDIEIGGLTPGTQFDRLTVSSTATLAGTLNLSRINGFQPNLGDTFVIMTYNSRSGTFSITGTDAGNGLVFQPTYGANSLILSVVEP